MDICYEWVIMSRGDQWLPKEVLKEIRRVVDEANKRYPIPPQRKKKGELKKKPTNKDKDAYDRAMKGI